MSLNELVYPDPIAWLQQFRFHIPIRVRFGETDALGHVNNVSYFIYYEQARLDYFAHLKISHILNDTVENKSIVAADIQCHFIAQIHYPDQLNIHARVARMGRSSMEIEYAISKLNDTDDPQLCAAGRGALVFIDLLKKKSTPIPDQFRNKIKAFEGMEG